VPLFGEVRFQGNRLLDMKLREIAKSGVALEPVDRLRHAVQRAFAKPLSFLQEREYRRLIRSF
jgi:phosphoserine phosphatase